MASPIQMPARNTIERLRAWRAASAAASVEMAPSENRSKLLPTITAEAKLVQSPSAIA